MFSDHNIHGRPGPSIERRPTRSQTVYSPQSAGTRPYVQQRNSTPSLTSSAFNKQEQLISQHQQAQFVASNSQPNAEALTQTSAQAATAKNQQSLNDAFQNLNLSSPPESSPSQVVSSAELVSAGIAVKQHNAGPFCQSSALKRLTHY